MEKREKYGKVRKVWRREEERGRERGEKDVDGKERDIEERRFEGKGKER